MSSKRGILKKYYAIGVTTDIPSNQPPAAVSGTMAADITGPTTVIDIMDNISFQVSWTSSNAVGVISVQGSIDGTNWIDYTFDPTLAQPASNNGSYIINMSQLAITNIRVKYTRTSGTGNMKVYMSAKGN